MHVAQVPLLPCGWLPAVGDDECRCLIGGATLRNVRGRGPRVLGALVMNVRKVAPIAAAHTLELTDAATGSMYDVVHVHVLAVIYILPLSALRAV
jgi:hypothetical protein